jgi:4-diphosphocytidyl-2-C-methyl-D-erythritol kinase
MAPAEEEPGEPRGPGGKGCPSGRLSALAPAKLNLYLHVIGRRADGRHLLDSLVAFADIGDHITVESGEGLRLACDGPFAAGLPEGGDNLVLRAAHALLRASGRPLLGAHLHLTKNLPIASGLGGGSADAAAALRLLAVLWRVRLPPATWQRLALSLGADMPVCLSGRVARMGGIGEELASAPHLPNVALVLVNPRLPLATAEVFGRLGRRWRGPAPHLPALVPDLAALVRLLEARRNDLEAPACEIVPVVADALAHLRRAGALLARMSGSGATCFGLFADRDAAARAAAEIAAREPGWWVTPAGLRAGAEAPAVLPLSQGRE